MIKEKRRRARKRKRILIAFFVILLVLALAALLVVKVFRVTDVQVKGNELYDAQMIEDVVLNDEYSWNSLYVFLKYRIVDTQELPFIDAMEVTLKNPHTLQISVYEKGMIGYLEIPSTGDNVYFDKDGFVVEISTEKIADMPKVAGIMCSEVVLYEKLPIDGDSLWGILTLTQALRRSGLVPESITYGGKDEPELKYGSIKVKMGDLGLLTQKVERLSKIMPKLKGLSGTLHLENWTEETTNIVFDKQE